MIRDWFEVSFSAPGESDWDEPVSVFAASHIRAAEERMEEEAKNCDDWLESHWDARVTKGEETWHVRLSKPRRVVVVEGAEYLPEENG